MRKADGSPRSGRTRDEPATTHYVPEHDLFLRRLAADNEADAPWEEYGTWTTDGPAVLMDSAEAGSDLNQEYPDGGTPSYAPLPLPPGTWRVRAAHTEAHGTRAGLVQLVPTDAHPTLPPHT
ncbi:Imm21 family immunity protein [Streptomyces tendae]|uniref:Imm21 family immunity protein n=1 Tax=Streptomyces tendae TaxID=1932 RepID=UPI0023F260FA|nr:Imm21 family immunity protein [Streptomyces tendae]